MAMVAFLNLIRWKNLLLIIYVQILLKFVVFTSVTISTNLTLLQFIILLISVVLITAAGYVINDIIDLKTDSINKPKKVIVSKQISVTKAQQLYVSLNTIGLILGIGLSLNIEKPTYSFIFIGTSLLLYYYSKIFKSKPIIGNFIVSFLVALMSVLILYFFDINKSVHTDQQHLITNLIFGLSLFAFLLSFIRELVKDLEDVKGDYNLMMSTLPILIGQKRTKKITAVFCVIPLSLLLYIVINFSATNKIMALYLLIFTILPLLYVALKLRSASSKKDFKKLSTTLKLIMFLGINALILFSLNM